jgi:enoyl-CoA hydratase/carnithine racemase
VGLSRALEVCATGRFIGAAEAVAWGLANTAVPRDELDDAARDLAAAVLSAPASAVSALKPLLGAAQVNDLDAQLDLERRTQAGLLTAMAAALKAAGG